MTISKAGYGPVLEFGDHEIKDFRNGKIYQTKFGTLSMDGTAVYTYMRGAYFDADHRLLISEANTESYVSPEKGIVCELTNEGLLGNDGTLYLADDLLYGSDALAAALLLFVI